MKKMMKSGIYPHSLPLSQREKGERRGMILILILACIAIAALLLITGVRLALTSHRVTRSLGWSLQAQWLAESGLERAAARLAADAEYSGETWNIPAKDLGGNEAAAVKIEVKPAPGEAKGRLVKVEADFPDDPLDRVQCSREMILELP